MVRSFEWIALAVLRLPRRARLRARRCRPPAHRRSPPRRSPWPRRSSSARALWRHARPRLGCPRVSILVGYFLSADVSSSGRRDGSRHGCSAWDRDCSAIRRRGSRAGRASLLACLEMIYMHCFLLIPGGLAALARAGRSSLADRYWTMVIAAEFAAFAPLAFIQTRPPWALEQDRGAARPRGPSFCSQHGASTLRFA